MFECEYARGLFLCFVPLCAGGMVRVFPCSACHPGGLGVGAPVFFLHGRVYVGCEVVESCFVRD